MKIAFISGYAKSHMLYNQVLYNLFLMGGSGVSLLAAKNGLTNSNYLFLLNVFLVWGAGFITFFWYSHAIFIFSIIYTILNLHIFSCCLLIRVLLIGSWTVLPAIYIFSYLLAIWRTIQIVIKMSILPTLVYGANIPAYFKKHKKLIGIVLVIYFIYKVIKYVNNTTTI